MFVHILYIQFHQTFLMLNVDPLLKFQYDLTDRLPKKNRTVLFIFKCIYLLHDKDNLVLIDISQVDFQLLVKR
jgi:hypothetical protein